MLNLVISMYLPVIGISYLNFYFNTMSYFKHLNKQLIQLFKHMRLLK
jgi:hypothetical protein